MRFWHHLQRQRWRARFWAAGPCGSQGAGATALGRMLGRLRTDASGHAFLEAALIFPIMVSIFLGISEVGEALTVSRRMEAAAGTSADLVARLRTVTSPELGAIKPMIDAMFRPFPTDTIGLVISSVVADADNNTTVGWSYADGAGAVARNVGSAAALPAGLTEPNMSVIFVEVRYNFQSTLAVLIAGGLPMQAEAYMRPRLVAQITKTD